MRVLVINNAVDLATAGNGADFDLAGRLHPFAQNNTAVVCLASADLGGDAVLSLEGRNDPAGAYAALNDVNGNPVQLDAAGVRFFEVVLTEQIREVVTETTGAGTGSVTLLGN